MATYSVLALLAILATSCTASPLEALAGGDNAACHGVEYGQVSNHYDCGSYFNCHKGYGVKQYCPASLQFNPESSQCDYPFRVSQTACDKGAPNAGDALCPQEYGVHFVANDQLCNAYFVCGNGLLQSSCLFCPYGQYFAVGGQHCQELYSGQCGGRTYVEPNDQTRTALQPTCQPGKGDPFRALNEKISYGNQYGGAGQGSYGGAGQGSYGGAGQGSYGVGVGSSNGQEEYYGNDVVNHGYH